MPVQIGKILTTLEKAAASSARAAGRVSKTGEKAELIFKKLSRTAVHSSVGVKSAINGSGVETISRITSLGRKESLKLFEYLPKTAQEDFGSLVRAGEKLGYIRTDASGKVLGGSMEKFLSVFEKDVYERIMYLEQNFSNLDRVSYRKLLNAYKSVEKLAANRVNVEKWLEIKDDLYKYSQMLAKEGEMLVEGAKADIQKAIGILPQARSKGVQSIYDKLSRQVFKGNDIFGSKALTDAQKYSAVKSQIGDLLGTRIMLDDVSPRRMQKVVDGLCQNIESGKFKVIEFQNYSNGSQKYFTEAQVNQLKKSAAKTGVEIKILESDQTSVSGYVTTQMNIVHSSGAYGEFQIRGKLMHKTCELEHLTYDIRQGKNIGKGIAKLEKLYEPIEDAVYTLKRKGLDKIYDDYVMRYYRYVRKFEAKEIKGSFNPPQMPSVLKQYSILSYENLEKIHEEAEKIKAAVDKVA